MVMRVSKDRIDMDDKVLQKPVLKDYGETVVTDNSGTSYTIDLTQGNVFNLTLTGNCAFTFSNPSPAGTQTTLTLLLTQDSTGSRTVTWPAAVSWATGTEPTLLTIADSVDIFTFVTINGGTTWFGAHAGGVEGVPTFSASYTDSGVDTVDAQTFTFSAMDIGAAPTGSETRVVAVAFGARDDTTSVDISSVTIGGVSATVHANATHVVSTSRIRAIVASAVVPSGTTADVVCTFSTASVSGCAIDVYRIMNPDSTTPSDTLAVDGDPASGTIDVPAGGILIAASQCINTGPGTWDSGHPTTSNGDVDVDITDYFEGGYGVYGSAQTGLTLSRDHNNTAIAAASWR